MNKIALVTANIGGIDTVKALPAHDHIDAFLYVDEATRERLDPQTRATWTNVIVPDYPRYDFSNRLRAKYFKLQIHRLDEVRSYQWLVWADSSIEFASLDFLIEWCSELRALTPYRRALFIPHPERETVLQEYEFLISEINKGNKYLHTRYANEKLMEQMEHIRARRWDVSAKLWCGGLWLMENTSRMHECLNAWWDQSLRYGIMDQLPLPGVLEEYGIVPQPLDLHIFGNPYFRWVPHTQAEASDPAWIDQLHTALQELLTTIPPKSVCILVDQDELGFGRDDVTERKIIPFRERDGAYWGPPSDDAAAIEELVRLREAGAEFIVFAWPAFWWLDYYVGFTNYLRSSYHSVFESERLVVFDLRNPHEDPDSSKTALHRRVL